MDSRPATLAEAMRFYADADYALAEAADSRWPDGVVCVHCEARFPVYLNTRGIWKCAECRRQFSFKAGTLFEASPIGLNKWLPAIWIIANDGGEMSVRDLATAIGVTQKTAWFMLHRVRLAAAERAAGS